MNNYILDEQAQKEALEISRKTLTEYLKTGKLPQIRPVNNLLRLPLGVFVTLTNQGHLRGCIGRFDPESSLSDTIQAMTIEAATGDPRFNAVTKDEVKDIRIEISVMTPKRKIKDWKEIEPGVHGVVLQKGCNAGTFLPQVALETGWKREEFLGNLCSMKAGLPIDCYKDPLVNLYVFEVQIIQDSS